MCLTRRARFMGRSDMSAVAMVMVCFTRPTTMRERMRRDLDREMPTRPYEAAEPRREVMRMVLREKMPSETQPSSSPPTSCASE